MKGFSLKKWIESYRAKYYEPSRDNDNFQDTMDYYSIAYAYDNLDKLSEKEIRDLKKKFIEIQKQEAKDTNAIFDEQTAVENMDLEYMEVGVPTEQSIRQLIGMVATGAKYPKGDTIVDWGRKAEKANKIVNTYVHDGYNIYPMLTSLAKEKKELEKSLNEEKSKSFTTKNGKPATINGGIRLEGGPDQEKVKDLSESIKLNGFGIKVLENAEELSPYKQVFDISDKIGELNRATAKALDNNDPNFDLEATQNQIEELRQQLTTMVGGYDPDFLMATADSRLDYFAATNSKMQGIHKYGLSEIKKSINMAEKLKEQQEEKNLESDKLQFTGVMGETPNIKDGINVVPKR